MKTYHVSSKCLIFFILIIFIMILPDRLFSDNENQEKEEMFSAIYRTAKGINFFREFKRLGTLDKKEEQESLQRVQKIYEDINLILSNPEGDLVEDSLHYYKAVSLCFLHRSEEALSELNICLSKDVDLFESLDLHLGVKNTLMPEEKQLAIEKKNRLKARYFPISDYFHYKIIEVKKDSLYFCIPPDRPLIVYTHHNLPGIKHPNLLMIGILFEDMGFVRDAIDNYIYTLDIVLHDEINKERADLWYHIAELELMEGQYELACRAYLKSAYWDPNYAELAGNGIVSILKGQAKSQFRENPQKYKETLQNMKKTYLKNKYNPYVVEQLNTAIENGWSFNPHIKRVVDHDPQPSLIPMYDREKIKEIILLYQEMGAHPFAMILIRRVEKETEMRFPEEMKSLQDEWAKIADPYGAWPNFKSYIFGVEVKKGMDWSQAPIMRSRDAAWKPYTP